MYSLDSDVVINFLNNDKEIVRKIKAAELRGSKFFISLIVLAELYEGAYKSQNKEKNLYLIEEFLLGVYILDFSATSCRMFGEIKNLLKTKGKPTQDFDLLIATITIDKDLVLITRNKKHFENIPNLKVELW